MMKHHSVNVGDSKSEDLVIPIEKKTLITRPMITTEKMCPVYEHVTAIFLLLSSLVINSLSVVVKPVPVNNEAT